MAMQAPETWLERLSCLAYRFEHYGITADLAAMDLTALWGVYCFLRRLADAQE